MKLNKNKYFYFGHFITRINPCNVEGLYISSKDKKEISGWNIAYEVMLYAKLTGGTQPRRYVKTLKEAFAIAELQYQNTEFCSFEGYPSGNFDEKRKELRHKMWEMGVEDFHISKIHTYSQIEGFKNLKPNFVETSVTISNRELVQMKKEVSMFWDKYFSNNIEIKNHYQLIKNIELIIDKKLEESGTISY